MTTVAIALVATLAAVGVAVLLVVGRGRIRSEKRLVCALTEMRERMDRLADELGAAVEQIGEEARRARAAAAVGQARDAGEVLRRVADAAASLPGAAASIAKIRPADGGTLLEAAGVDAAQAADQTFAGPPDGSRVRAVAVSYHYRSGEEPEDALRSAIAVPVEAGGRHLGFIAVYARTADAPLGAGPFGTLEALAEGAGPAIESARRLAAAARPAVDPHTGLGSRTALAEALAREIALARDAGTPLAVLLLDVDDLQRLNASQGLFAGDEAIAELAATAGTGGRAADSVFRSGGDEIAVVMPGAHRIDAEAQFTRIQATLRRAEARARYVLAVSGGIAELVAGDDVASLLERAHASLGRAKAAGKGTAA